MPLIEHDYNQAYCRPTTSACPGCSTEDLLGSLANAVRRIAHGGIDGPAGLEALTMAIGGSGPLGDNNLTAAVNGLASELNQGLCEVGMGLRAIARAIESRTPDPTS